MKIDPSVALNRLQTLLNELIASIPNLVLAFVVLLIFYLLAKLTRSIVRRATDRRVRMRNAGLAVGRLAQGAVLIVGLLASLSTALPTFKPGDAVGLLGIGSVAIGFAFRDIFQNFLAGLLLLLTQPFRIGDQIVIDNFEGTVEDIQSRATLLKTYDGRRIVIPNADLFTDKVIVNTAFTFRRVEYDLGIGYGDSIEDARQLIVEAIQSTEDALKDPAPDAVLVEFAPSTVNIRARWWVSPAKRSDLVLSRDRVLTAIKKTLTEHGIDLPFPTQQILLHDQTEETDGDRSRQREGWPAGKKDIPKSRTIAQALEMLNAKRQKDDSSSNSKPLRGANQ